MYNSRTLFLYQDSSYSVSTKFASLENLYVNGTRGLSFHTEALHHQ